MVVVGVGVVVVVEEEEGGGGAGFVLLFAPSIIFWARSKSVSKKKSNEKGGIGGIGIGGNAQKRRY